MSGHARTKASYLKREGVYLLFAVSSWIFVKDNFCDMTQITGESMAPTLSPAFGSSGAMDTVLWRKHLPTRNLTRGDVVLFSTPHRAEGMATKRVVALGGDTVLLDPRRRPADAQNGRPSEAGKRWDVMYAQNGGRVVIPPGHVWVEGDNWRKTQDSNAYGPISRSLITGKAVSILWPLRQFGQTPWKGWKGRTKVVPGKEVIDADATCWTPS
ncbi:uncharacterized protein RCC_05551 [Ramularia collo-cygni]|uniref:Mitochondrial inner membrane protease subunit n=1 Tax=Ramularia collo-cygni TaxID=112498 RepID=A0A2D3VDE2_9PEZI|nr:uncharacterized protein RCC_05551 [Ramularia collo-cygni]CZT19699.1 uncharacterized protein RCC_05551 [Ramularia collo-cygni]